MKTKWQWCAVLVLCLNVTYAFAQQDENYKDDPWESFNREVFGFNERMDRYVLKPVAQGYKDVTPDAFDEAVTNVFSNIGTVGTIANDVFQLKGHEAASDTARLLINSTFGLLGIFDVASHMGLEKRKEDFGQTLGYWGVESGPYVVLPFLGPSTVRDAAAKIPDSEMNVVVQWDNIRARNSAIALDVIDTRADLLETEKVISGDRYTFIRDAYLQNREYQVKDGEVTDSFDDEPY